jgi:hypothetical protein
MILSQLSFNDFGPSRSLVEKKNEMKSYNMLMFCKSFLELSLFAKENCLTLILTYIYLSFLTIKYFVKHFKIILMPLMN